VEKARSTSRGKPLMQSSQMTDRSRAYGSPEKRTVERDQISEIEATERSERLRMSEQLSRQVERARDSSRNRRHESAQ
jgi:hypothetical protein